MGDRGKHSRDADISSSGLSNLGGEDTRSRRREEEDGAKEKGAKKQVVIQPEVTHGGGGLAAVKSDLRGDSYLP